MKTCSRVLLKIALLVLVLIDTCVGLFPHSKAGKFSSLSIPSDKAYPNRHVVYPTISLTTLASAHFVSSTALRVSSSPTRLSEAPSSDGNVEDDKGKAVTVAKSALSTVANGSVSRFRKLKDIMWVREAVEDVTAAEFACSVESSAGEEANKKRKRAVDYEKLLSQLDRRVADMLCIPSDDITSSEPTIDPESGMGRFAYSQEERKLLLK
jgi:hypothetical protein